MHIWIEAAVVPERWLSVFADGSWYGLALNGRWLAVGRVAGGVVVLVMLDVGRSLLIVFFILIVL